LAQLNNSAVAAAGGAYQAMAGIPYIGPALGAAAAVATYAGVMSFGAMTSAEGGYDIPGNINPIVQTHAREMILPAKHADVIRTLADQGQGQGAAVGGGDVNVTISGQQLAGGFFMAHQSELVKALKQAARNGHAH
jgi:hypothetical protein